MSRTASRLAVAVALSLTASAASGQDLQKTQAFVLARNNFTELTFKTTFAGPLVARVELPARLRNGEAVTLQLIRMPDGRPVVAKEAATRPEARELEVRADLEANMTYKLVARHTGTSAAPVSGQLSFVQKRPTPVAADPAPVSTKKPVPAPAPPPPFPEARPVRPVPAVAPDLFVSDVQVNQAGNSIRVVIGNNGGKASAVTVQLDLRVNGTAVTTRTADLDEIRAGGTAEQTITGLPFGQLKAFADNPRLIAGGVVNLTWSVTAKVTAGVPDKNPADNAREAALVLK